MTEMTSDLTDSSAAAAGALPPPRWSWPRALGLAAAAVYAPHLVMGLYAFAFVSCQHCRGAVAKALVIAPGVELWALSAFVFRFPYGKWSEAAILTLYIALTLLALAGVAAGLRRWPRWRWLTFTLAAVAFSTGAYLLLAMIRA